MDRAAFMDELVKLSVRLTKDEEAKQARGFALAGSAAMPVISAIGNKIQSGKAIPAGVSPKRWLAGNLVSGALFAGALPAVRSRISEGVQDDAEERLRRKRISQGLKEFYSGRT